jgi:hypothetical protein
MNPRAENGSEHAEISALLPWFVNSTLTENVRLRVEAHVDVCRICRDDLALEKQIFEKIDAETAIDYVPSVSLKRLQSRLDALETESPVYTVPSVEQVRGKMSWRGLMAASVIIMALAGGLVVSDRWLQFRAQQQAPNYRTVTSSAARPQDEVIRVVFAPTITLVEMQTMLEEARMRIVSGPTEAGVYSLAANSSEPVSSSLALLRRHATVRFAEATRPEPEPGSSP